MQNLHNFPQFEEYLKKRHISADFVSDLISRELIKPQKKSFLIAMRNIEGDIVGWQERYFEPIIFQGKELKSKSLVNSQIGVYFTEIDFSKSVIITEGDIDFLCLPKDINHIGLQGVQGLNKLLHELISRGVPEILLIIDNDEPADSAISTLFEMERAQLSRIFDCREFLGKYKDVNEFVVSGGSISLEGIEEHKKSLNDFLNLRKSLLEYNEKGRVSIHHKNFSKYLIEKFIYESCNKNIFTYTKALGIREPIPPEKVQYIIIKHLEQFVPSNYKITTRDVEEILKLIKMNSFSEELEKQLTLVNQNDINLEDGIFNITTNAIRPYLPKEYKRHKLPYHSSLLQSEKLPHKFLNFLNQALEDYPEENRKEIIEFLRQYIAHLFLPITKFELGLFCRGAAAAGKGTFINTIQNLIGEENVSNLGMHNLEDAKKTSALLSKLVNLDSEMKFGTEFSHSLKQIISGERIESRFLYKDCFFFSPYARIIVASNSVGAIKNHGDKSVLRRFAFINFRNSFVGKENFNLKKEILDELPEIFSRSCKTLPELLKKEKISIPKILIDEAEQTLKEQDHVLLFLEEKIEKKSDSKLYNSELYPTYEKFCKDNGEAKVSQIALSKRMVSLGFRSDKDHQGRFFYGLVIKRYSSVADVTDVT